MKKLTILLLSICYLNISAQTVNGNVHYKLKVEGNIIDSIKINKKDEKYGGMLSLINRSLSDNEDSFEYKLKFNKKESLFEVLDLLENDNNKSYKIALALSGAKNIYYYNNITKEKLIQKNAYGEKFIVAENYINKWELENNSKKIFGYTCYKASFEEVIKNSKGTFYKAIEAWYAPDIPINFGPKGYVGLPGLILELKEGNFKYYCTKIDFNPKKNVIIKKPSKGKLINQSELDSIGRKLYNKKKKIYKY